MIQNIIKDKYTSMLDSYTSLSILPRKKEPLVDQGLKLEQSDIDIYTKTLKKLAIEINEENIKILKKLENYDIEATKQNFESYLLAKNSLDDISSSLDYDSAIKLVEMDVDIENESIHKIAMCLEEIEEEKEGLSVLNTFKKQELTTEEAQDIAKKLYGSNMGKDITDIIKSLHKKGVSITKKNIEKINDIFYKLDKLKSVEDETFIDALKNKLDINIDNLYKAKMYIKNGEIKQNINADKYETLNQTKLTNKDLRLLEDDIKDLIKEVGLELSQENIKLSKEFIKKDIAITKENISRINEVKQALKDIIKNLDYKKASQLVNEKIDIDTEDIIRLSEKIKSLNEIEIEEQQLQEDVEENIEQIMRKIELLKKVDEKELLTLLKRDVDFEINKIEQVIFTKTQAPKIDISHNIQATLNSIQKISTAFKEIAKLDLDTIAFQIKNNIPVTIMNIKKNSELFKYSNTLLNSVVNTSTENIQKAREVYTNYYNLKENLTSKMILKSIKSNIEIENIDINLALKYVNEYKKQDYASKLINNTQEISQSSEENLMFLIKNKKPLSLLELGKTNSMFKNKDQVGHKISQLTDFIYKNGDEQSKQKVDNLKKNILEISKNMKISAEEIENAYKKMEKSLEEIFANTRLLNQEDNNLLSKTTKELSEKLEESKGSIAQNKIIQFPVYMNGQFTNLNMYFRDRKKEGLKINLEDMCVVLNIDTVNMGNLNINLDIDKKNVNVKIGLQSLDYKSHIEGHKKVLEDFLEKSGYSIGEVTFYKEGQEDNIEELPAKAPSFIKGNLDITI